jgi:hypothetical protein
MIILNELLLLLLNFCVTRKIKIHTFILKILQFNSYKYCIIYIFKTNFKNLHTIDIKYSGIRIVSANLC